MPVVSKEIAAVPASAIVPTRNRPKILLRTLQSLGAQGLVPAEVIIVDASDNDLTQCAVEAFTREQGRLPWRIVCEKARERGAAVQRNQGYARASQPLIWFFDDDILFEPDCLVRLWAAMEADANLAGVSAMITNQRYQTPGRISRLMFRLMAGQSQASYAGRVLGPAINLLPEDADGLPEVVSVQWLNTTCTLYRRDVLPEPPFPSRFTGYSLMEDLTLSLTVGSKWNIANARTARVYHDSQPGEHKDDIVTLSRMELVNRHYVMTEVLKRSRVGDYAKLTLWELFQLAICALQKGGIGRFWKELRGKRLGVCDILYRDSIHEV